MDDRIYIRDLRFETVIGLYGWERQVRQVVSMDLDLAIDVRHAALTDDIAHSANYKTIAKRLIEMAQNNRFQLVETLAERAATLVMEEFGIKWVRVGVSKPGALRFAGSVGVIIERGQPQ